ncbi:uncharacterized protein LOC4577455 isoform X2 [Anopheles gambiae]|uniref:uncharacterized protein LOC4577455 isoform X2 n=1 Tax=Anopheles gambiae TaxID=7165 RepID=UPI002AC8D90D|nr:uncharacterized protein LOC4577455 isoform X2 [Anopheles gambiae]
MLYNINEEDTARIKNDLLNSFRLKRLAEFTQIINRTKNSALKQAIVQSVFETVLTQPNSKTYLQACLAHGARVNKKSCRGEYPIHLAAKSRDINNLKLLLLRHEVNVNQLSDDGNSATDFIWPSHADELSADTFAKSIECINLLHKHGATIDTANLEKRLAKLKQETEILAEFMQGIEPFVTVAASGVPATETETVLLENAITCGNLERAKQIIESHASPQTSPYISKKVLTICFERGCFEMLEYIFQILPAAGLESRITKKTWLSFLVQRVTGSDLECRFFKCLKLCLTYPQFDIDERNGWDYTALHYAATLKLKHLQELLLQKGAYIGGRDIFGVYTISQIDPLMLVRHFDSCVYTSPRIADEHGANSPIVYVMLNNFAPPKHEGNNASPKSKSNVDVSYESMRPALMELTNVCNISHSEENIRQQLIEHPVISTLLYIRDPPVTPFVCFFRCIRLVPFMLMFVLNYSSWFILCEFILLFGLFIFEFVLNFGYFKYFCDTSRKNLFRLLPKKSITMLIEIVMILSLMYFTFIAYNQLNQLVCCILLAGINAKRFFASWKWSAKNIYALEIVMGKIILYILNHAYIFIVFAYVFYVQAVFLNVEMKSLASNSTESMTNTTLASISIANTLLDQLAMFIGELNIADKRLDSWFSALTVGSFLIIVPISLANLISASAIVDVMKIYDESRRIDIALRFGYACDLEHPVFKFIQYIINRKWWLMLRDDVKYIAMDTGKNFEITLHVNNSNKQETLWQTDRQFAKRLVNAAFANQVQKTPQSESRVLRKSSRFKEERFATSSL